MTDQERQLIEGLASRIRNAPAPQIDREAGDLIRRAIGAHPDALYVLTQTVLIQEMALTQAKQQIDDLQRQQPPASFLGNAAPASPPPAQSYGGYRGSSYQTSAPPPLPPQYEQQPPPQSRFSGFLQNAAQTAAGVVAGEVAFSALSSLFGHHGGYGGYGSGFFGGAPVVSPVSETIINNYYEDDNAHGHHEHLANDYQDVSDDLSGGDQLDDSSYDDGSDLTDV